MFAMASAAHAATLEVAQGEVLLSQGTGYETLKTSMELSTGDTVIAQPGSVARITFADGCSTSLNVGTVFRIGKLSPCAPHSAGEGASGVTNAPGGYAEGGQVNYTPYILGAAGIGGIVAIAVSASGGRGHHHSSEPPASP
jgi:hypothetical protein